MVCLIYKKLITGSLGRYCDGF